MGCVQANDANESAIYDAVNLKDTPEQDTKIDTIEQKVYEEKTGEIGEFDVLIPKWSTEWIIATVTKHYFSDNTIKYSCKENKRISSYPRNILIQNPDNILIENIEQETSFPDDIEIAPLYSNTVPISPIESNYKIANAKYYYSSKQDKGYLISMISDESGCVNIHKFDISEQIWSDIIKIPIDGDHVSTTDITQRIAIDDINENLYLLSSYRRELALRVYDLQKNQWIYHETKNYYYARNITSFGSLFVSYDSTEKMPKFDKEIFDKTIFSAVIDGELQKLEPVTLHNASSQNDEYILDIIYCKKSKRKYIFTVIITQQRRYHHDQKSVIDYVDVDDKGKKDERVELTSFEFRNVSDTTYRFFKPMLVADGVILMFRKKEMFLINTVSNIFTHVESRRNLYGLNYCVSDVLCDRKNRNLYFLSPKGIQMIELNEMLPLQVYGYEIMDGYVREYIQLFVPMDVINLVVGYMC